MLTYSVTVIHVSHEDRALVCYNSLNCRLYLDFAINSLLKLFGVKLDSREGPEFESSEKQVFEIHTGRASFRWILMCFPLNVPLWC